MDDVLVLETDELPEDLLARVKAELVPGERLLWAARAAPRGFAPQLGPFAWFGGLTVLSVACFATVFSHVFGQFVALEGLLGTTGIISALVAFLILLGMLGRWLSQGSYRQRLSRQLYALTDRRAILWTPMPGTVAVRVQTIERGSIKAVHRIEYPDGSGDVALGRDPDSYAPTVIQSVADVRLVEDLVRRTLVVPEAAAG